MSKKYIILILLTTFNTGCTHLLTTKGIQPVDVRCEYLVNPLGIDAAAPRFSWKLRSDERAQIQSAYRICAASSEKNLRNGDPDLWDSGRVLSDESVNIPYAGKALQSGQRCYWQVRCWDKNGEVSKDSDPAFFEMGLLAQDDWHGKWIAADTSVTAPLFRKEFQVTGSVAKARAYVTGLGYYELYINGKKVGKNVLDPGWTEYRERVLYAVYDISKYLNPGVNIVGIILGNGWYNPLPLLMWGKYNLRDYLVVGRPRALLQMNVDYENGSRQEVVTDGTWKTDRSPNVKNSVYLGEEYDARLEQDGWDRPGFNDAHWQSVDIVPAPGGILAAQTVPPIMLMDVIKPVQRTEPKPGTFVFDMGENLAGWAQLQVRGDAGTKVKMRYGELIYPDGTLNGMTAVCGQIKRPGRGGPEAPDTAWQCDTYICKGAGTETWHPRFTFHGFRYVEVTGYPGIPPLDAVEGHRLHSHVPVAGTFRCSNELINRIQDIVPRTFLSNMFSVQSDCPGREKFGYGGDIIACCEAGFYNFDMSQFYGKTVQDFADATDPATGGVPETAPFVGIASQGGPDGRSGPPAWGSVYGILPWYLYQYYNDIRILEEHYEGMKAWVQFLGSLAENNIVPNGLGDWISLVPKEIPLTSTGFYYHCTHLVSKTASILGKMEEAEYYAELAMDIKNAFNAEFLDMESGKYGTGIQTSQVFPLYLDIVPPDKKDAVVKVLLDDIQNTHDGHLSTGIYGTRYMLDYLSEAGYSDVAYSIVTQADFPGWGYMLDNGATTLWEVWKFSDNSYSHNHPMFGSVSAWFYKTLAGIQLDTKAPGFKKIRIKPYMPEDMKFAEGSVETIRGAVSSKWRKNKNGYELKITIPANCTALVYLPRCGKTVYRIEESGKPIWEDNIFSPVAGISTCIEEEDYYLIETGSGMFSLSVQKYID